MNQPRTPAPSTTPGKAPCDEAQARVGDFHDRDARHRHRMSTTSDRSLRDGRDSRGGLAGNAAPANRRTADRPPGRHPRPA